MSRKDHGYSVKIAKQAEAEINGVIWRTDARFGTVQIKDFTFIVDNEGVFTIRPLELGGEKSFNAWEVVDEEKLKKTFLPKFSVTVSAGNIEYTGEAVPLVSFVRSFGHRLESNYAGFCSFLKRVEKCDPEQFEEKLERRRKVENAVDDALEAVIGYTPMYFFDGSPWEKVKNALCEAWREEHKDHKTGKKPARKEFYPEL